jgi:hypothetical protein
METAGVVAHSTLKVHRRSQRGVAWSEFFLTALLVSPASTEMKIAVAVKPQRFIMAATSWKKS